VAQSSHPGRDVIARPGGVPPEKRDDKGPFVRNRWVWGLAGLGAGFGVGLVVSGKLWDLPPALGDIPTWISAIATIGLLIGAIVTARYAIKTFGEQSQEVRDQASMLKVQSDQLEEQRKINALQAGDLEESLKERARLRQVAEREQADAVLFEWWPVAHVLVMGPAGGTVRMTGSVLAVRNESRRRIVNVTCRIEPSEGAGLTLATEQIGTLAESSSHRAMLRDLAVAEAVPLMRPGTWLGFLVRFDLEAHPDVRLAVRFTDDAGLHWQIDQNLHLAQLDNRGDW
jgi:hypothetical protein